MGIGNRLRECLKNNTRRELPGRYHPWIPMVEQHGWRIVLAGLSTKMYSSSQFASYFCKIIETEAGMGLLPATSKLRRFNSLLSNSLCFNAGIQNSDKRWDTSIKKKINWEPLGIQWCSSQPSSSRPHLPSFTFCSTQASVNWLQTCTNLRACICACRGLSQTLKKWHVGIVLTKIWWATLGQSSTLNF